MAGCGRLVRYLNVFCWCGFCDELVACFRNLYNVACVEGGRFDSLASEWDGAAVRVDGHAIYDAFFRCANAGSEFALLVNCGAVCEFLLFRDFCFKDHLLVWCGVAVFCFVVSA